jgi:hypothetical protein
MHNRSDIVDWNAGGDVQTLTYPFQYRDVQVETPVVDPEEPPLDTENPRPSGFAEWFALSQTLLPALLFLPGSQAYRLPLRVGAYGISVVGFGLWWFGRAGRGKHATHPSERYLLLVLVVLGLSIAHPLTNSLLSGLAQTSLYFAIFCPLFWARGYITTRRQLVRVLLILLLCNGINSIVGVMQVYDPDRWMPRELSSIFSSSRDILSASSYVGPGGRLIIRPPGLFDTPGAVCGAGTIAALFGLILSLEPLAPWKRGLALAMSVAGISAIYLSHVRVSLVVTVGMMAMYVAMLVLQKQTKRLAGFTMLSVGLVAGGLSLATLLGGTSISDRFSTLLAEDPRALYYQSRGQAVEYAFDKLLVDYPLGAGLARWGMMRYYFGNPAKLDTTEVFAEVQPNAWILDGGIFLLAMYGLALIATAVYDLKLVRALADRNDRLWAAAVVAANFGTLALVFSFVPFGTAAGMQFWFLEGALHGAMDRRPRVSA